MWAAGRSEVLHLLVEVKNRPDFILFRSLLVLKPPHSSTHGFCCCWPPQNVLAEAVGEPVETSCLNSCQLLEGYNEVHAMEVFSCRPTYPKVLQWWKTHSLHQTVPRRCEVISEKPGAIAIEKNWYKNYEKRKAVVNNSFSPSYSGRPLRAIKWWFSWTRVHMHMHANTHPE